MDTPGVVTIHPAPAEQTHENGTASNGIVSESAVAPVVDTTASKAAGFQAFSDSPSNLTIAFKDVNVIERIPEVEPGIKTVITPITDIVKYVVTAGKSARKKDFYRLKDVSGIIKPGTLTLVMAPPGHGKSSYLKAICNRIQRTSGTVLFNGRTSEQALAEGCYTNKMMQFVDQVDAHLPLMTVRETLDFAHRVSASKYDPDRVTKTIQLLGLEECEHTVLGDAFIRGVSGGQKRRVTLGEMLVGDASTLFLDEYTNGLDTATSEDITKALRMWCKSTGASVVATLQQPTPGLYNAFDNIVCLRDSQVVFDGPRVDLLPYLHTLGYHIPDDIDICDYLIDVLSQPRVALELQFARERKAQNQKNKDKQVSNDEIKIDATQVQLSTGEILKVASTPCISTAAMLAHYRASPLYQRLENELADIMKKPVDSHPSLFASEEAKLSFGRDYSLPMTELAKLLFQRQFMLNKRNKSMTMPRVMQSIMMGLLYGSLYYKVGNDEFFLRVATLLICLTQIAFGNMVELPISVQGNRVVFKQNSARFYPTAIQVWAWTLMGLPLILAEIICLTTLIYWLSDCAPYPDTYFIFFIVVVVQGLQISTWFRMLSATTNDEAVAQSIAGPSTGVFMLFGGFFVTLNNMPVFMRWIFWISPFSWSVRSLANNEFLSKRYNFLIDSRRAGDVYIETLDMFKGMDWVIYGIIYHLGLVIVITSLHAYLLNDPYREHSKGTKRFDDEPEGLDEIDTIEADENVKSPIPGQAIELGTFPAPVITGAGKDNVSAVGTSRSAVSIASRGGLSVLRDAVPFTPTWMSFSNIRYTVKVMKDGEETDRVLLDGISGYAEPGKLTALMGASGAGKTTLLDVLAGRKTMGVIEGKILFNGVKPTALDFARTTGYVEQFDSLLAYDTVRETLMFAASLRLPRDISLDVKSKIVDEVLDILDLTPIENFIIGNERIPGLSPSQLKRVNIGCELVANPAILFLDEPTTGLDSRSAQTVMRVVRRIARSGRSVICTIHQPSAELFFLFDRLVLLASGGHQIYFGDLGSRSKTFVKYLSSISGIKPIPPRMNPASWMLEEIGVGVAALKDNVVEDPNTKTETTAELVARLGKYYFESPVYQKALSKIEILESLQEQQTAPVEQLTLATSDGTAVNAVIPAASPIIERTEISHQSRQDSHISDDDQHEPSVSYNGPREELSRKTSYSVSNFSTQSAALPTKMHELGSQNLPNVFEQIIAVNSRRFRAYFRNPPLIFSRMRTVAFLSVLFGLIYLNLKIDTQVASVSYMAAVQVTGSFVSLIHGASATPTYMVDRAAFYRERASGMYKPWIWTFSMFLSELVYVAISAFFGVVPVYFMVGFLGTASAFFKYYFATYICALLYCVMSILVTSIAPTTPAAGVIQGMYFGFFFTFAGIAITTPNIPAGYMWLFRGLPMSHVTEAMIMPQFEYCTPLPNCGPQIKVLEGGTTVFKHVPAVIADYLGFSYGDYWNQIGWTVLFMGSALILAFVATNKLVFANR